MPLLASPRPFNDPDRASRGMTPPGAAGVFMRLPRVEQNEFIAIERNAPGRGQAMLVVIVAADRLRTTT